MRGIDHRGFWRTLCRLGLGAWWLSALMGCMPVGGGLAVFPLQPPPGRAADSGAQAASPAQAAAASGTARGVSGQASAYAGARVCTSEPAEALAAALETVPGRVAHDSLLVAWRRVDKVAASGSDTMRRSSVGQFMALCDRLEAHGDLEGLQAARLKELVVCALGDPEI